MTKVEGENKRAASNQEINKHQCQFDCGHSPRGNSPRHTHRAGISEGFANPLWLHLYWFANLTYARISLATSSRTATARRGSVFFFLHNCSASISAGAEMRDNRPSRTNSSSTAAHRPA